MSPFWFSNIITAPFVTTPDVPVNHKDVRLEGIDQRQVNEPGWGSAMSSGAGAGVGGT